MIVARRMLIVATLLTTLGVTSFASAANILTQGFGPKVSTTKHIDLLLTWRAESLTPPWYQGRILPTRGSKVKIYLQGFENGKTVDLSSYLIRWRVNDIPRPEAFGKTTFELTVDQYAADQYTLFVDVSEADASVGQITTARPIERPQIVINLPYPNKTMPLKDAGAEALFYFFTATNPGALTLSWNINGAAVPESELFGSNALASFDSAGDDIPVVVNAKNPNNQYETAQAITHISVK